MAELHQLQVSNGYSSPDLSKIRWGIEVL